MSTNPKNHEMQFLLKYTKSITTADLLHLDKYNKYT